MIHWCTKITRENKRHPSGPNDQFSQEDKHEAVVQRFEHTLNVLNRSGLAHQLKSWEGLEFFLEKKPTTSKPDGTGSFPPPLETSKLGPSVRLSLPPNGTAFQFPVPTSQGGILLQQMPRKVSSLDAEGNDIMTAELSKT